MEALRKPFQGVLNIMRFNWHFYLLSFFLCLISILTGIYLSTPFNLLLVISGFIIIGLTLVSLIVSCYVYDFSNLYSFNWLNAIQVKSEAQLINIHAGFDETSVLLKTKYRQASLQVFDFYDPLKHTEISIRRARRAYPPYPDTMKIETKQLPLENQTIDYVFVLLSAHEIRNAEERKFFFYRIKSGYKTRRKYYSCRTPPRYA